MQRLIYSLICCLLIVSCRSSQADYKADVPAAEIKSENVKIAQVDASPIKVVYPGNDAVIPASSTFVVGSVPPGQTLTVNGSTARVNAQGYYAHVVPLQPGANKITLSLSGAGISREVRVTRELPRPPISADTFKIDKDSAQPKEERGVAAGDLLELSVRATPQAYVEAQLGKRHIVLRSPNAEAQTYRKSRRGKSVRAQLNTNINTGMDAAFGKMYQRKSGSPADLYVGFYRVAADDRFENTLPRFTLFKDGKSSSVTGSGAITVVTQPMLVQSRHDNTIVRLGPGQARTTPMVQAVRLLLDGWQGDQMRCLLAGGHHVWIAKDDLVFETDAGESGPAPQSVARTINTTNDSYGASIIIPLNQRLPYQVEQQLKPSKLILRIYGVTADIDWITPLVPPPDERDLIDHITWRQAADNLLEVTAHLKSARQWGFKVDYDDTRLTLHVKRPPALSGGAQRLKGCTICVDPGHGGKETGSIGCSGMKESEVNLGIAMNFKNLLEKEGAKVMMTRLNDVDVSLDERVRIAVDSQADLLISIHNNALPDGRDPWAEHGTSSYWYHPQAIELAKTLKTATVKEVGFPDFASRWQNLALTRPSAMPSVLVEVGFMIHPDEFYILSQPGGQRAAAQGIIKGLIEYLSAD